MFEPGVYSVDRIEGDQAILVDKSGDSFVIALCDLPDGLEERTVLQYENGAFRPDAAAQRQQEDRIKALQDRLRKRK